MAPSAEPLGGSEASSLNERVTVQMSERMQDTGDKDRLKEFLRRTLEDSGWRQAMKLRCREAMDAPEGPCRTVDEIVDKVKDLGKSSVPQQIYARLVKDVATFVRAQAREK